MPYKPYKPYNALNAFKDFKDLGRLTFDVRPKNKRVRFVEGFQGLRS